MSKKLKLKNTMNQNQQNKKNRTLKMDRYFNYQPYVQLQHRRKEPFLHTSPRPPPCKGSAGTIPNIKLFWSVLLSTGCSVLLRFLLQWSWLAVPNLNLWCPPPEWARDGDSSRDWLVWFWNGDHFPLHWVPNWTALMQEIHNPHPTKLPPHGRVCGLWPAWTHSTVFLQKALEEHQAT